VDRVVASAEGVGQEAEGEVGAAGARI